MKKFTYLGGIVVCLVVSVFLLPAEEQTGISLTKQNKIVLQNPGAESITDLNCTMEAFYDPECTQLVGNVTPQLHMAPPCGRLNEPL